jgi:hypothetical protein
MRPETSRELWSVKYQPNRNGVQFVKRFLVGRVRDSLHTSSAKKLTLNQSPIVTVTWKAFFDVGHSLKDQKSNHRSHLLGYAAWEIHPVMKLKTL